MSNGQKSIILTILKIFNWQNTRESNQFHIAFYSLKASTLIMEKSLNASTNNNEIIFNYSLRISYLQDQNQIIIKLSHYSSSKKNMNLLGQFTLNLDYLGKKKIQFFPFGKNDKVLKITVGQIQQAHPAYIKDKNKQQSNQDFIRQKESFLKNLANNTSSTIHKNQNSRSKKSFSQKAQELFSQIQTFKRNQQSFTSNQVNDYYCNTNTYSQKMLNPCLEREKERKILKSESQQRIKSNGINSILAPSSKYKQENRSSSNRSQKHKLQLKNLDLIPVQSEYYDEAFNQRKLARKSDILLNKKEKWLRSQLN